MTKPLKIQGKYFLSTDYKATSAYDTAEELSYSIGLDKNSRSERDRVRFAAINDNFAGRLQEWESEIRTEIEASFNEQLYAHDFSLANRYFVKTLKHTYGHRWRDYYRPLTAGELESAGHCFASQIPHSRLQQLSKEWVDDFRG